MLFSPAGFSISPRVHAARHRETGERRRARAAVQEAGLVKPERVARKLLRASGAAATLRRLLRLRFLLAEQQTPLLLDALMLPMRNQVLLPLLLGHLPRLLLLVRCHGFAAHPAQLLS